MKKIVFYCLAIFAVALVAACGSDSSIDSNVTFPKEVIAPEGVRFSYLMFEENYNAVPQNGNPVEYTSEIRKSETSGMSFALSDVKKYAPGVNTVIDGSKDGVWCKISFDCFKKAEGNPDETKGFLVVSYHRGDSTVHYVSYPIYDLLKAQNKQFIDKWENFLVWHEIPENVQSGDQMKIYQWNPKGSNIYLDDFMVEVWTTAPAAPDGVVLSHGLMEENYELAELGPQITKETAFRGVSSCMLSAGGIPFGKGYTTTLADANIGGGDYVKVVFSALKKQKTRMYLQAASMVVSLNRGEQQILWKGTSIDSRLLIDSKQALNQWVTLEIWEEIPADAQPTDLLKIYPWNAQPTPIYIDDLRIEVWKKGAPAPTVN